MPCRAWQWAGQTSVLQAEGGSGQYRPQICRQGQAEDRTGQQTFDWQADRQDTYGLELLFIDKYGLAIAVFGRWESR